MGPFKRLSKDNEPSLAAEGRCVGLVITAILFSSTGTRRNKQEVSKVWVYRFSNEKRRQNWKNLKRCWLRVTSWGFCFSIFRFTFHFAARKVHKVSIPRVHSSRMSRSRVGGWVLSFGFVLRGITAEWNELNQFTPRARSSSSSDIIRLPVVWSCAVCMCVCV